MNTKRKTLKMPVRYLMNAVLVVLLFPFLRDIFGLTVLPAAGWWTVAGLALAPLAVVEIVKGVTALLRRKPREAGEESR